MPDLRVRFDLPLQPPWLRRAQIATVIGMVIAVALQFCRLAFGYWQHSVWIDVVVLVLQVAFIVVQFALIRWRRSMKSQ